MSVSPFLNQFVFKNKRQLEPVIPVIPVMNPSLEFCRYVLPFYVLFYVLFKINDKYDGYDGLLLISI